MLPQAAMILTVSCGAAYFAISAIFLRCKHEIEIPRFHKSVYGLRHASCHKIFPVARQRVGKSVHEADGKDRDLSFSLLLSLVTFNSPI